MLAERNHNRKACHYEQSRRKAKAASKRGDLSQTMEYAAEYTYVSIDLLRNSLKVQFSVTNAQHFVQLFSYATLTSYFDVSLTVRHSIDLFHLPTLMRNSFIH